METKNQILKLSEATVFGDLNKVEGKAADFARDFLKINTLKYKHFRQMQKLSDEDQMHHAMLILTGLTEEDLGELPAEDSAELTGMIYEYMRKYVQLGKRIREEI